MIQWYNGPKGAKRNKKEEAWGFQYLKVGGRRLNQLGRARRRNLEDERKPGVWDADANRRKMLKKAV